MLPVLSLHPWVCRRLGRVEFLQNIYIRGIETHNIVLRLQVQDQQKSTNIFLCVSIQWFPIVKTKKWVFASIRNFFILTIPDGVNLWYFKLRLFNLKELKGLRDCDTGLKRYRILKIRACGKYSIPLNVQIKIIELQSLNEGPEEGQPQHCLVRATFSSFSRPSHLEILVLRLLCVWKFLIFEYKTIFLIWPR